MREDKLRRWLRGNAGDPKRYAITTAITLCMFVLVVTTLGALESGTLTARTLHINLIVWPLASVAYGVLVYRWQIRG